MGLFDNIKVLTNNVSKNVSVLADNVAVAAKETQKINSMKKEVSILDAEINKAYTEIGRKLVEHILATNEMPNIDIKDTLNILDVKMTKKTEIKNAIIEIEKAKKDQLILHEKERAMETYLKEKEKLDNALAMNVITTDEYNKKILPHQNKITYFDEIKNIEQQYSMSIISFEEKNDKIEEILNRDPNAMQF